jgi:poly(3-hydroxybutyrate) depolymerase
MCARPTGKIERVRPQDITTTALLTVEGELDDISGSGQTEAAHDLCTGIVRKEQRHLEAKGAGHYGIFSGRRWRETVYPVVRAFILEHQTAANLQTAVATWPATAQAASCSTHGGESPGNRIRGPSSAFRCAHPQTQEERRRQSRAKGPPRNACSAIHRSHRPGHPLGHAGRASARGGHGSSSARGTARGETVANHLGHARRHPSARS